MDQGEIYEEGTPEQIYIMQFADGENHFLVRK